MPTTTAAVTTTANCTSTQHAFIRIIIHTGGVIVVVAVVVAGIIAAAALYLHYRKEKQAVRAEVASTATRATRTTHGADERAGQGDGGGVGEGVPSPYLQMAAGVPTAEVLPVGLPVAASEEMVTVVADGSWAPAYPASGGSWAPASGGGAAAESGAGLVVVTGLVLPNV